MARKLLTLFAVSLLLFPMWLELKAGEPFTLVIDAGHGGKDPGAKGKIINEKEINLKIALKLGQLVRSNYWRMIISSGMKVLTQTRLSRILSSSLCRTSMSNKA